MLSTSNIFSLQHLFHDEQSSMSTISVSVYQVHNFVGLSALYPSKTPTSSKQNRALNGQRHSSMLPYAF